MNPTNPCRGHAAENERAEGIEAAVRELRLFIMGESLQTRKEASKHLETLVAECDRLTGIIANPMMHGMTIRDGALEMSLEGPGPALLAGMFIGLLDRFPDAQNYVECSFSSAIGPITVTVQKPGGKTPHALRVEAETELAASKAECARLSSMLDHQRDESTETERMLRSELEAERIRLAACGVVALSNTPESAAKARDMRPEYRSASCDDVARMVDEQMHLRASLTNSQNRLFDVLVGDDGQAWKEAERYLERERPDLYGALNQRVQRRSVPEGWRDAVQKLENLPSFLSGWKLSESCIRNDMGTEVSRWIDGLSELYKLYAAPAPDHFRNAAKMMAVQPSCMTCGDHGMIGGLLPNGGGYESDPCPDCTAPAPAEVPMPEPVGWYVSGSDPEHAALWLDCPDDEQMQVMNQQCDDGPVTARPVVLGADAKRYGDAREATASQVKALMDDARRQMYELLTGEARLAPATPAEILGDAQRLIARAQHAGVVLTIETVSVPPWAMGRYVMRAATRPARQPAEKQA